MSPKAFERSSKSNAQAGESPLAPAWHTVGVILLLCGIVFFNLYGKLPYSAAHISPRLAGYIFVIVAEWLVVYFIWLGPRWGGASLRTLLGDAALTWRSILRDVGLAIAFLIVANVVLGLESFFLARYVQGPSNEAMRAFLPQGGLESTIFLLLAVTAGICEEFIFRGYLQRHFSGWTRSAVLGIILQGILFGGYHAPLGLASVITNAIGGALLYGTLAAWRRSLRPGMIAHIAGDAIGVLVLARYFLK